MTYEVGYTSKRITFDEAWLYCLTFSHNGHKDWRLPTWTETQRNMELFHSTWVEGDELYQGPTDWFAIPVRDVF